MSVEYKAIYNEINRSLFYIDGQLDYSDLTNSFIELANLLNKTEQDENIWFDCSDNGQTSLADLIVGAYWHFTEWHGGQYSDTYAALCALGQVFSPGMTSSPEPDSPEYDAYQALNDIAESINA